MAKASISRPKRAADEFARASLNDGKPSSKKPRFDARNPSTLAAADEEEGDAILELDEIGRGGAQAKRNAVRLDGYDSDSSNENFDSRAQAKADAVTRGKKDTAKSKDEEADDMFADFEEQEHGDGDEDEEVAREGKKQKKEVRFMDEDDIQGQVASSKSGGHVSADFTLSHKQKDREVESSSDESAEENDEEIDEELGAGAKKRHAPKLDAFNMRNEAEEGKFDANGNFVRNAKDPFAVHDSWLEGSSKAEMKRAREAEERRDKERRERDRSDDALSMGGLLSELITRMDKGETVLESLARLAKTKQKTNGKAASGQKNKRKTAQEQDVAMDIGDDAEADEDVQRKEAVEAITGAADQLLTRGQSEIYEAERELLIRQYKRETGDEWRESTPDENETDSQREWEYRWSDSRDGGDTHGPYDGRTMNAWNESGFFAEGVEFREIGTMAWSATADFV